MKKIFNKIINRYHYSLESIKNRYPCKIIRASDLHDFSIESKITYIAATKINIRTCTVQDVAEDPLLIEKFHPTDTFKLGFIAFAEIILRDNITIEEARKQYHKIIDAMFAESVI